MSKDVVVIDKAKLLGKGGSKVVYVDPRDAGRCIKIIFNHEKITKDLKMEIAYRRTRKIRRLPSSKLMVEYYGTVETDMGTGFVFERVADYDGETSRTFEDIINLQLEAESLGKSVSEFLRTEKEYPDIRAALRQFRQELFEENIIIPDMGAFNYVVQFEGPTKWRVRIVDDIGCHSFVPLMNWIDYFGRAHVRRRWDRFIREIASLWPGLLSEREIRSLMVKPD